MGAFHKVGSLHLGTRWGAILILVISGALVGLLPVTALAEQSVLVRNSPTATLSAEDWKYEVMEDEAGEKYVQILRYTGPDVDVPVVPATIEGVPVTHVYFMSYEIPSFVSVDVSQCVDLVDFNCVYAGIEYLDLSNNGRLEVLNVSRNNLTELDLSHNPELRELDCDNNQLTELSIAGNPKLERLVCNDNAIADLTQLQRWASSHPGAVADLEPQNTPEEEPFKRLNEYTGDHRYEVAQYIIGAALGHDVYKGVIIVSGEDGKFADALSASSLSGLLNYPVVLTNGESLLWENREALKWLRNSINDPLDIIVVGGPDTVSDGLLSELVEYGNVSTRIGGSNRYELSRNVYEYGCDHGGWSTDTVLIAKGNDFPDALSIAPYASSRMTPILLVDQGDNRLDATTGSIVSRHRRAVVLGGENSVSRGVFDHLERLMPDGAIRLGGANRFEASRNIVSWEISQGMSFECVGFSTGHKFTDSLASGFLLGKQNAVLLIVDGSSAAANAELFEFLSQNASGVTEMNVFGGPASVSQDVRDALLEAVDW